MLIAHALRCLDLVRGRRKPDVATRLARIDWTALHWRFLSSLAGEKRGTAHRFDQREADWRAVVDDSSGMQRQIDYVDPLYGNAHRLGVWFIEHDTDIRIFAAGEVSNGVMLVFVPADADDNLWLCGATC